MGMRWYVLRCQSGREDQARESLLKQAKLRDLGDRVAQVIIPTQTFSEVRGGVRRVVQRKTYPGYLMVELAVSDENGQVDEDTWYLIREAPGIGDFVGPGRQPVPMQPNEVERLLGQAEQTEGAEPRLRIEFKEGDAVHIKEGPFENFEGVVEEVIPSKGLVRVVVTIFGRPTPVELEYWQVEAL
jgi:transcriptional antiterminator NusG